VHKEEGSFKTEKKGRKKKKGRRLELLIFVAGTLAVAVGFVV
jgi:hypothetical protein